VFEVEYKGGNTVVITTKKSVTVTDPKQSVIGLKDVVLKDAIELATESRFAVVNENSLLSIEGPGDYGVADIEIHGIVAQRHLDSEDQEKTSTMYRLEYGGVRVGVVGNIYEKLDENQLEELGVLDILIIPVGGNGYTLDAIGAVNVARKISPKVVIPVHYADKGLQYEVAQDDSSIFTKELGAPVEKVTKYKVKNTAAIPAALTVIELERN